MFPQWFRLVAVVVAVLFASPWIFEFVYFLGGSTAMGWCAAAALFAAGVFLVLRSGRDSHKDTRAG